MTTICKTKYGKWRALVRVSRRLATSKNFRIKRDAETWARVTENEMIRVFTHLVRTLSNYLFTTL